MDKLERNLEAVKTVNKALSECLEIQYKGQWKDERLDEYKNALKEQRTALYIELRELWSKEV